MPQPSAHGPSPPATPWTPGARLGDYQLVTPLGSGGMGAVWQATHVPTGAARAIKLVRAHAPELLTRLLREGEALARLGPHPHLVRVHAAGVEGDTAWLAMDLVPGPSLAERLRAVGSLGPDEAATLVRDLARGLSHAHARGVLHRDLKPENVVFDEQGAPRLLDFGLAHVGGAASLTTSGELLGTPTCMAPEQVRGERVDARADVYGLGVILYRALTGRYPFEGRSVVTLLAEVLEGELVAPRRLRPEIPLALEAACLKALARDPAQRFPDALALESALAAFRAVPDPARRAAVLASLALIGLAATSIAVILLSDPGPPSSPGRAPPLAAGSRAHAAGSGAPARQGSSAPALSLWARRMAEAHLEVKRQDRWSRNEFRQVLKDVEGAYWERRPVSSEARDLLERGAAAGDPDCEKALARLLLRDGPSEEQARALELLWRSSRQPEAEQGAGLDLAAWLAVEEPEVARALLEEAARRKPVREWGLTSLVAAASARLLVSAPGTLGAALIPLREHAGSPDIETALELAPGPGRELLQVLARWEGWCGAEDEAAGVLALRLLLERGLAARATLVERRTRAAALRWVRIAAALGDPDALGLLRTTPEEPARLEELHPLDLLAFDRSRGPRARVADAAGEDALRRAALLPASERDELLRPLALRGHARAQWALARAEAEREEGDPRREAVWACLAALEGTNRVGLAEARVTVGRDLLLGRGGAHDPLLGARWLAEVRERDRTTAPAIRAQLWLGLSAWAGRAAPQGMEDGARTMREALRAARELDQRQGTRLHDELREELRRLRGADPWVAWAGTLLAQER